MSSDESDSVCDSFSSALGSDDSAFILSGLPVSINAGDFVDFDEEAQDTSKQGFKLLDDTTSQSANRSLVTRCRNGIQAAVRYYLDNYILLILTAALGVATNVTCIKTLSQHVSVFQITAVRSLFCSISLIGTCWMNGISLFEPRKKFPLFLMRGIFGAVAFLCLALSTFELPLSDSAFLSNSYPVVTALMSWLFGMEHLGALSWVGVAGCFIGNALVAHPPFIFGGHESWGPSRFIGVVAASAGNLFMGSSFILIRYLGKGVNGMVLTTYMHMFSCILSIPFMFTGTPIPVNTRHSMTELICYGGTCLMGICLQLASTRALQIGPPTKVTSIFMLNMLLSGFVGIMAFGEQMSMISGIGAAIIVVSVVLVTAQKPKKKTNDYQLVSTVEEIEECELADQGECLKKASTQECQQEDPDDSFEIPAIKVSTITESDLADPEKP